jgi:hypothetical protein
MATFAKDALFASFNLANLVDERRDVADRIWGEVMCLFRTKALKELPNTATFSFSDLGTVLEGLDKATYKQAVVTADPGVLVKVSKAFFGLPIVRQRGTNSTLRLFRKESRMTSSTLRLRISSSAVSEVLVEPSRPG